MKKLYVQPLTWYFETFESFVYTVVCWECNKDIDVCPVRYDCPLWKIRVSKNYRVRLFRPHFINDKS